MDTVSKRVIMLQIVFWSSLSLCLADDKGAQVEEFKSLESAYMSDVEKADFLKTMNKKLAITARSKDPFGLVKNYRENKPHLRSEPVKQVVSRDFEEAIKALKISGASANKVLIGAEEYQKGSRLKIVRQGKEFKVRVISANSASITFQNMDNGKTFTKNLFDLPNGITSDNGLQPINGVSSSGDGSSGTVVVE